MDDCHDETSYSANTFFESDGETEGSGILGKSATQMRIRRFTWGAVTAGRSCVLTQKRTQGHDLLAGPRYPQNSKVIPMIQRDLCPPSSRYAIPQSESREKPVAAQITNGVHFASPSKEEFSMRMVAVVLLALPLALGAQTQSASKPTTHHSQTPPVAAPLTKAEIPQAEPVTIPTTGMSSSVSDDTTIKADIADPNDPVAVNGRIYRVGELSRQVALSNIRLEQHLHNQEMTNREKTEQAGRPPKSNRQ